MKNSKTKTQLPRFAAVGALSTAIDLTIVAALRYFGLAELPSVRLGFFAGFITGYNLNSRYVFMRQGRGAAARYFIVSAIGLALTELIVRVMVNELDYRLFIAKLVAVGVVFCSNFTLSKFWAFREKKVEL